MVTILIEGKEYEIEGDIFTTPDGEYDVFWTNAGYAYVPTKREKSNSYNSSLANKSYFSGVPIVCALVVILLFFIIGVLK